MYIIMCVCQTHTKLSHRYPPRTFVPPTKILCFTGLAQNLLFFAYLSEYIYTVFHRMDYWHEISLKSSNKDLKRSAINQKNYPIYK